MLIGDTAREKNCKKIVIELCSLTVFLFVVAVCILRFFPVSCFNQLLRVCQCNTCGRKFTLQLVVCTEGLLLSLPVPVFLCLQFIVSKTHLASGMCAFVKFSCAFLVCVPPLPCAQLLRKV